MLGSYIGGVGCSGQASGDMGQQWKGVACSRAGLMYWTVLAAHLVTRAAAGMSAAWAAPWDVWVSVLCITSWSCDSLVGKAINGQPPYQAGRDVLLCAQKAAWLCWELLPPCRSVPCNLFT